MSAAAQVEFFVLAVAGSQRQLFTLTVELRAQEVLGNVLEESTKRFLEAQASEYVPGYHPDDEEVFCIDAFPLPTDISPPVGTDQHLPALPPRLGDLVPKALIGRWRVGRNVTQVVVRRLTSAQVLRPGTFIALRSDTNRLNRSPGIVLSGNTIAVHSNGSLRFISESLVNPVIPLDGYYESSYGRSSEGLRRPSVHRVS